VNLVSADVGINNVKVTKGTSTLIDNASTSGVDQYTDYAETQVATMTFGAEYGVEVARTTTVNPMNRKVWIDFNIDGDFTDVGEEVLTESAATTASASAKFNVPFLKNSFEGNPGVYSTIKKIETFNKYCLNNDVRLINELEVKDTYIWNISSYLYDVDHLDNFFYKKTQLLYLLVFFKII
jgi:hypothetical protein